MSDKALLTMRLEEAHTEGDGADITRVLTSIFGIMVWHPSLQIDSYPHIIY